MNSQYTLERAATIAFNTLEGSLLLLIAGLIAAWAHNN